MGLESATYISGLTPSWPGAGETKSQGDDHLRLIKSVLQGTFPNASRAFRFPTTEAITGALVLDATDENNLVTVDTAAGNIAVTLPAGLTTAEKGWRCQVVKTSSDINAVIVSPSSGTINSRVGATATIRVGLYFEPATFIWSGTLWICSKPGTMIGSTENYDGSGVPRGYLAADGAAFSSTDYAELFAVLASSVTKDKRGRSELGAGTGTGLTNRVLGQAYGTENGTLVTANLPAYTPSGTISSVLTSNIQGQLLVYSLGGTNTPSPGANQAINGAILVDQSVASTFTGAAQGGSSTPFNIIHPTIGVTKIIRAC